MSEHILRVTRAAGDEHEAEYGMVCQAAKPKDCIVWWECAECEKLTGDDYENFTERLYEDGESEVHGLTHQMIDGSIMHIGSGCVTQHLEVEYDFDPEGLPVGNHPVSYDCDEGYVYVTLAPEVSS